MIKIALLGQKGGSGKTTIAVGLSVAAALAGHTVAIVDLDPQATAARWKDRRKADNPACISAQASRLPQALATAEKAGVEIVVIDSAGRSDDSALAAARAADFVLIPTRTSIVEIETLPAVLDLLRLAGNRWRACLLLNGVHPSAGTAGIAEARQILTNLCGLSAAPVHVCQRDVYAKAMVTGQTPQEIDPDGKAGSELNALFSFVWSQVHSRTGELAHA